MSDDFTVTGGGVTAVATDDQVRLAQTLAALGDSCSIWADRVATVTGDDYYSLPFGPFAVAQADARAGSESAARAAEALREAAFEAGQLAGYLNVTAEQYGAAERAIAEAFEALGGAAGWVIGNSPALLVTGAAVIAAVVLLAIASRAALGLFSSEAVEQRDAFVAHELRNALATPAFADAVRLLVSSSDQLLIGAGGIPAAISAHDLRGEGVTGVAYAALIVARRADATGLFDRTGVSTVETSHRGPEDRPVTPPTRYEDLMDRMPKGGAGSSQVRIERHLDADGTEQWIVWSGGTIEAGFPEHPTEPWDNRSNLNAVAGSAAESTEATLAAMQLAEIPEGASVLHVGYSQGGIVAASIAASGRYDSSLVTFGSPVETVAFAEDVPRTHVEHTEDIIPALSGLRQDPVEGGAVVQRSLYDGGHPPYGDDPLPAHSADRYRETARLIDASPEQRTDAPLKPLSDLRSAGESWEYRADRVK